MTVQETSGETAVTPVVAIVRESPFAQDEQPLAAAWSANAQPRTPLPPQHTYGAASMQTYADGQVAYNTHASADGFVGYVSQFEQTSFRVKDAQVQWWQYDPPFDDWQNNYGCDSVEVFYHAGHGGTDSSTGNYSAPLGAAWDNQIFLNSNQMSIGDQRLRYLYLATCEGCMVFAPNNPIRTWSPCNKGLRMLFGATANIYDNPNYGTNYWNHWNSGDSFSQAWQDSLLDAGSGQQPSSMAAGSSGSDASARLFNERYFTNATVSQAWYWWRWVGNAPAAGAMATSRLIVPSQFRYARIAPRLANRNSVLAAMKRLGFNAPANLPDGPLEGLRVMYGATRFAALPAGFLVERAPVTLTESKLTTAQVTATADAFAGLTGLSRIAVLPAYHAGGPAKGGAGTQDAQVYEHMVIYRQEVNGLPVLTPGVGELRVHVAASGAIRRILDTTLDIGDIRDSGPIPVTLPTPNRGTTPVRQVGTENDVLAALNKAAAALTGGGAGTTSQLIASSIAIGYALRGTDLVPVARATVEIGYKNYKMLEAIEVDLVG